MRLSSLFRFTTSFVFVSAVASAASAQTPTQPPAESEPPALAPAPTPRAAPPPVDAPEEREAPPEAHEDRSAYISISPFHLLLPFIELTGEVKLHPRIGVSAIAGYGSIRPALSTTRFDVWELGGQLVTYPVGHFDHGMQLGVEALYANVSGNDKASNVRTVATANGPAVGPFVGYKLATRVGFTFNVQLGFEYLFINAEATASNGQVVATATDQQSRFIPLLNANVGWSF